MPLSSRTARAFAFVFVTLATFGTQAADADWIGNVHVAQPSGMHMSYDDHVVVNFDYEITSPNGARIWCYAYTVGGSNPPVSVASSPIYTGTGTSSTYFLGLDTPGIINRVGIVALDAVTDDELLSIVVPAYVHLGEHGVFDMSFSHSQPSWLALGERLVIDFNATTTSPEGAYVFMRPMTGDSTTPGYSASGGVLIPTGTASGNQYFTFPGAERDVDAIRVQMVEAGTNALLEEFFVPVRFGWRQHGVANVTFDPPPPAWLPPNHPVTTVFDYHSANPDHVHGWAWGWIGATGYPAPMTYQASNEMPLSGSMSRWFKMLTPEDVITDEIHVVLDDDGALPYQFQGVFPADYHFGPHAVYNIAFDKAQPAILDYSHRVNLTFDYATTEEGGVRIWVYPYTDGSPSPDYAVQGSPLHPVGTGSGASYFRILSGDVLVDQLRIRMATADGSVTLLEFFVDVTYFWGQQGILVAAPPDRRAIPTLGLARPNPFNPSTTIDWSLPVEAEARVRIYDVSGRLVKTLAEGSMAAGPHQRTWDGRDDSGRQVASGVYYYQLSTAEFTEAKKMTLVK